MARMIRMVVGGVALVSLVACGDDGGGGGSDATLPQCEASGYVAFDPANHQSQDIRVATIASIVGLLDEARGDFGQASAKFTAAKSLYTDLTGSASLREKVQGRTDDHLTGEPVQGDRLDATLIAWFDEGIAAVSPLSVSVAKQWVDKTFTEFLYLSVYHELVQGTRAHWDEAYGYYGTGPDNRETDLAGLAVTANKRDANNGTSINAAIFNDLIDGSCALGTALRDAGLEEIDIASNAEVAGTVDRLDENLQEILAYSVGHEAIGMQAILDAGGTDTDGMWVKLAELEPFFVPLERLMNARGGASASRAAEIRGWLDLADFDNLADTSWVGDFAVEVGGQTVPERIIEAIETEFSIDILG